MSVEVLPSRSPLRFAVIDAADMYASVVLLADFNPCRVLGARPVA